jgi:hypothetical protein
VGCCAGARPAKHGIGKGPLRLPFRAAQLAPAKERTLVLSRSRGQPPIAVVETERSGLPVCDKPNDGTRRSSRAV